MYIELDSYVFNGFIYDDFYCGLEDRWFDFLRLLFGVNINVYFMIIIEFELILNVFLFLFCIFIIK